MLSRAGFPMLWAESNAYHFFLNSLVKSTPRTRPSLAGRGLRSVAAHVLGGGELGELMNTALAAQASHLEDTLPPAHTSPPALASTTGTYVPLPGLLSLDSPIPAPLAQQSLGNGTPTFLRP